MGAKLTLSGPNYAVTPDLGKQVGGNLFHSFSNFGLDKGESAVFTGPATVNQVISRVTGGSISSINGKIDSSGIPGANFYLINPSGVVFGPNATINVAGSFHAATADYIKLSDGARFQATNPSGSTLTAAAPAAFGFLTASPPALTINGSQLTVPAGQTLGMAGGPGLAIGNDAASGSKAALSAPAGTIHVTSVAGTGEVPVDPTNTASLTVSKFGPVNITQGSLLDVSDPNNGGSGGSIFVRAGTLTVDASELNADNYGSAAGGRMSLSADTAISVTGGSTVHATARSLAAGPPAALSTSTDGSILVDGSTVSTESRGSGNAGALSVTTGTLTLQRSGAIKSLNYGLGSGGPITVDADSIGIDGSNSPQDPTGIFGVALPGSNGNAGDPTVTAGNIRITGGGGIASLTVGSGNGGHVAVNVRDALTLDGTATDPGFTTGIATGTTMGSGNAGSISITAGSLTMVNGAEILAPTFTSGRAGNVSLQVDGAATIDGSGISPLITGIIAGSAGTGHAGNVTATVGSMSIKNGGLIFSGSFSTGQGGDISLTAAGSLSIGGPAPGQDFLQTGLLSGTLPGSRGNAGNVAVTAGSLSISDLGVISSGTAGAGNAGKVSVTTAGALSIDGVQSDRGTGIFAATLASSGGNGGEISVGAGSLSITNGGSIGAGTFGPGNGGNISLDVTGAAKIQGDNRALSFVPSSGQALTGISTDAVLTNLSTKDLPILTGLVTSAFPGATGRAGNISVNAGSLDISNHGVVFSPSFGPGNGGTVTVHVGGALSITGTAQTGLVSETVGLRGATGNAGDIAIDAGSISLTDNGVISSHALLANGGSIGISTGGLLYLKQGRITTQVDASTGNGGNITIVAPQVVLDRSAITADAFGSGSNGNIDIVAGAFVESVTSSVRATGVVTFSNPPVNLTSALVVLPSELRGAAAVLRDSCAGRSALPRSSLTYAGRGGLAQDPDAMIPALYFAGHDADDDALRSGVPSPSSGIPAPRAISQHSGLTLTIRCGL